MEKEINVSCQKKGTAPSKGFHRRRLSFLSSTSFSRASLHPSLYHSHSRLARSVALRSGRENICWLHLLMPTAGASPERQRACKFASLPGSVAESSADCQAPIVPFAFLLWTTRDSRAIASHSQPWLRHPYHPPCLRAPHTNSEELLGSTRFSPVRSSKSFKDLNVNATSTRCQLANSLFSSFSVIFCRERCVDVHNHVAIGLQAIPLPFTTCGCRRRDISDLRFLSRNHNLERNVTRAPHERAAMCSDAHRSSIIARGSLPRINQTLEMAWTWPRALSKKNSSFEPRTIFQASYLAGNQSFSLGSIRQLQVRDQKPHQGAHSRSPRDVRSAVTSFRTSSIWNGLESGYHGRRTARSLLNIVVITKY